MTRFWRSRIRHDDDDDDDDEARKKMVVAHHPGQSEARSFCVSLSTTTPPSLSPNPRQHGHPSRFLDPRGTGAAAVLWFPPLLTASTDRRIRTRRSPRRPSKPRAGLWRSHLGISSPPRTQQEYRGQIAAADLPHDRKLTGTTVGWRSPHSLQASWSRVWRAWRNGRLLTGSGRTGEQVESEAR